MTDADDTISFLTASTTRARALRALASEGELARDELYDRLDASRRTVKRALAALSERGFVACGPGGERYRLTSLGDSIAAAYRSCIERTATAERLAPFLSRVDADAFDLDVAALADAEVVVATDAAPFAPLDRFLELRANARSVRVLSPLVQAQSLSRAAERVGDDEFRFAAVVSADAVDAARSTPEYERAFRETLGADSFETYRYEGTVPFVVALIDGTVALGVTEGETPHALVLSENERAREWATATFERYRDAATTLG